MNEITDHGKGVKSARHGNVVVFAPDFHVTPGGMFGQDWHPKGYFGIEATPRECRVIHAICGDVEKCESFQHALTLALTEHKRMQAEV